MQIKKYNHNWALVGVLSLGIMVRLRLFCDRRSLWLDECYVAENIINRSWGQLTRPLDYDQVVPFCFAWVTKAFTLLMGFNEYSFRIFPLLASLAGLVLLYKLCERFIGRPTALVAVFLYSICRSLIWYSNELKPYGTDVLCSIFVLYGAFDLLANKNMRKRKVSVLMGVAALLVWFSNTVIFVLAGTGIVLLLHALLNKDKKKLVVTSLIYGASFASFIVCFILFTHRFVGIPYFQEYVADGFPPLSAGIWGLPKWCLAEMLEVLRTTMGWAFPGLGTFLIAAGSLSVWKKSRPQLLLLLVPIVLLLLAAVLRRYPMVYSNGRTVLFMLPVVVILASAGIQAVRSVSPVLAIAAIALLTLNPLLNLKYEMQRPTRQEHIRPVLMALKDRMRPQDTVYIYYSTIPAMNVYEHILKWKPENIVYGESFRKSPARYEEDIQRVVPATRVWFLFSHQHLDEEALIKKAFQKHYDEADRIISARAGASLFILRKDNI